MASTRGARDLHGRHLQAPARIIVLARGAADFGGIARDRRWTPLPADMARRPWTDDYSNVLEALWDQRRSRPKSADRAGGRSSPTDRE